MIEYIPSDNPYVRSAAFSYGETIKVVIAVVSFNPIFRRWEYETLRYLKEGELHYVTWDIDTSAYTHTEIPIENKEFWIKQLKKYVDGM